MSNHGIAATWERHNDFIGQVFCFLPLPPYTSLPVYINGQFVLISNRRSLWVNTTEDPNDKTRWNDSLKLLLHLMYSFLKKQKITNFLMMVLTTLMIYLILWTGIVVFFHYGIHNLHMKKRKAWDNLLKCWLHSIFNAIKV